MKSVVAQFTCGEIVVLSRTVPFQKGIKERDESIEYLNLMNQAATKISIFSWLFFLLVSCGCLGNSRTYLYQVNDLGIVNKQSLDRLVWENALGKERNISNKPILKGELSSYFLVQVRRAEKPHRHELHDLTIFLQSGYGTMFLGKSSFKVNPGAIIFVPRGTTHYFVNAGFDPAVAITVFSPSYDGKDNILVEPGSLNQQEESDERQKIK